MSGWSHWCVDCRTCSVDATPAEGARRLAGTEARGAPCMRGMLTARPAAPGSKSAAGDHAAADLLGLPQEGIAQGTFDEKARRLHFPTQHIFVQQMASDSRF